MTTLDQVSTQKDLHSAYCARQRQANDLALEISHRIEMLPVVAQDWGNVGDLTSLIEALRNAMHWLPGAHLTEEPDFSNESKP